jgi:hypothetical protein
VYVLYCLAKVWRQIGQKLGPLLVRRQHLASCIGLQLSVSVALGGFVRLETVANISLVDSPKLLLKALAFLRNAEAKRIG